MDKESVNNCPVCESTNLELGIDYKNVYWTGKLGEKEFDNLKILVCNNCGLGFTYPPIDKSFLSQYYEKEYRKKGAAHFIDFERLHFNKFKVDLRSLAQLMLAKIHTEFSDKDVFIDVGAGSGSSFYAAQKLLPNPILMTVELDECAIRFYQRTFNKKIKIFSNLDSIIENNGDNLAKIILMSHSLEHFEVEELDGLLHKIFRLLMPTGVLIIEVPHVDLRQTHHRELRQGDTPHLCFFSQDSLKRVLEKAGFEVLLINTFHNKWNTVAQNSPIYSSTQKVQPKNGLKKILKTIVPMGIRSRLRRWQSNFTESAYISFIADLLSFLQKGEPTYKSIASPDFCSGEDRTVLRAVAKKVVE